MWRVRHVVINSIGVGSVGTPGLHTVTAAALQCPLAGCGAPPPVQYRPYTLWSDPATWAASGLSTPVAGQDVTLDSTMSVILDVSPPPLGTLTIQGRLSFLNDPSVNLTLTAGNIVVYGQLIIGNASQPYQGLATVQLTGIETSVTVAVDNAYTLGKGKLVVLIGGPWRGIEGILRLKRSVVFLSEYG